MMLTQNKRLIGIIAAVAFLLLIPLTAMQFTSEVKWSVGDFIVAAGLLLGAGLLCELVLRTVTRKSTRITICIGILVVLALIWVELAVGLFGTPFAGS